jgi:DNA repair protein RadD
MIVLRDYQKAAVDAVVEYFGDGNTSGRPLVVLPTGAGKSYVIAALAREDVRAGRRCLILTHRDELLRQNRSAVTEFVSKADVGTWSSMDGRKQRGRAVTVASIDSLRTQWWALDKIDTIIIDEAHLVSTEFATRFATLHRRLAGVNPAVRVVGLTATPYRLGTGRIDDPATGFFNRTVYEEPVGRLVARGYLCPLVTATGDARIVVSGSAAKGNEFTKRQLSGAAEDAAITRRIVQECVGRLAEERHWLCFGVSVAHAEMLHDAFASHGVSSAVVHGQMDVADRRAVLERFRSGDIRCVVNCEVLTTGYDFPEIDAIIMARPTMSLSLYCQMAGRGLRRAEGKRHCVVLDFAGNIARFGPLDAVTATEASPPSAATLQARESRNGVKEIRRTMIELDIRPSQLPILSTTGKSFWELHNKLLRAGYPDSSAINRLRYLFRIIPAGKHRMSIRFFKSVLGANSDSLRAAVATLVKRDEIGEEGYGPTRVYWRKALFIPKNQEAA